LNTYVNRNATILAVLLSTSASATEQIEVTVTATRQEANVERTSASVSILTREQIQSSGVSTVNEALSLLPGLFIARNGSVSSSSSIFLRGAKSNHTIILLDGVRLTSTTDGRTAVEHIPLASVERIELVRGGLSSLYGSDGIGGVIQIFTRKTSETRSELELGVASQDTQVAVLSHTRDLGAGANLSFTIGRAISDGYDVRNTMQPDSDGYKRSHADISLSVPHKNWTYRANSGLWRGVSDYDASFGGDRSRSETSYLNLRAEGFYGRNTLSLLASRNLNRDDNYLSTAAPESGDSTRLNRDEMSAMVNTEISNNWSAWAGSDYRYESAQSPYITDSFFNTGVFGGLKYNETNHTVDVSFRSDRDSRFGTQNTWGTGYVYQIDDSSQLFASYRTAFAGPSHQDIAYGNNPNLAAESSTNRDLGVRTSLIRGTDLQLTFFSNQFRDLIQYDSMGVAYNVGKANAEGAEITAESRIKNLALQASYIYTKTKNLSEGDVQLLNRPTHMASASATLSIDASSSIALSVDRVIDYTTPGLTWGARTEMPSYTLWSAYYERDLSDSLAFNLRVDNLLDKYYETLDGYDGRGRYIAARLNYTF